MTEESLSSYLRQIGRFPLLDREEETRLAREFKRTSSPEIRDLLIRSNLRIVVRIARQHQHGAALIDLIQEGNVGLIHGVDRFDPYRGIRLNTYAAFWIRAFIYQHLLFSSHVVKIGTTRASRTVFFGLGRAEQALRAAGIEPTSEALAARMGVSLRAMETMRERMLGEVSLDAPLNPGDADSLSRLDFIEDSQHDALSESELAHDAPVERAAIEEAMKSLPERERKILVARYHHDEPATLGDLAKKSGISRERVRQLEARAIDKVATIARRKIGGA